MTSEELAAAGIPPAKEEVQETDNAQLPRITQLLLLHLNLKFAKKGKSDLREKISEMLMLIFEILLL
jgi:hypothetical protein